MVLSIALSRSYPPRQMIHPRLLRNGTCQSSVDTPLATFGIVSDTCSFSDSYFLCSIHLGLLVRLHRRLYRIMPHIPLVTSKILLGSPPAVHQQTPHHHHTQRSHPDVSTKLRTAPSSAIENHSYLPLNVPFYNPSRAISLRGLITGSDLGGFPSSYYVSLLPGGIFGGLERPGSRFIVRFRIGSSSLLLSYLSVSFLLLTTTQSMLVYNVVLATCSSFTTIAQDPSSGGTVGGVSGKDHSVSDPVLCCPCSFFVST